MFNLPLKVLERQTLAAPAVSVTFTIGTLVTDWDALAKVTSRHLVLIVNAATIDALIESSLTIRFNADAGNNYNLQYLMGRDGVASGGISNAIASISMSIPGANLADAFGGGMVVLPHAFNAVNHKATIGFEGSAEYRSMSRVARWASTVAITSITLTGVGGNLATGSEFILAVVDERYLVEEILLAADGPVTFRNIPQLEGDLAVVGYCRSDIAGNTDNLGHEINDDGVAGNYHNQYMQGLGAGAPTAATANNTMIGICVGDNPGATIFSPMVASYSQYGKATNQPHCLISSGYHNDVPGAAVRATSARRVNIEPITKLQYTLLGGGTDFKAGSLFSLYHVPKRLIERVELAMDTATITFDSIPQDFEALIVKVYARSAQAIVRDVVVVTINDDAVAANYDQQEVDGAGGAVSASRSAGSRTFMGCSGANRGAGQFNGGIVLFPAYAKADRHKHLLHLEGENENLVLLRSKRWENMNPIIKIALATDGADDFKFGSVFELWGILPTEGLPAITVGG